MLIWRMMCQQAEASTCICSGPSCVQEQSEIEDEGNAAKAQQGFLEQLEVASPGRPEMHPTLDATFRNGTV